jgi:lipid-A-disaccharide synthase
VHLVKVNHISEEFYHLFEQDIDAWYDSSDLTKAMRECHFAFAASGTVTLSTGLFELPTVVCYKASLLNEFIYYNFIKYQGPISLTNIIHNKIIFPEYIQGNVTPGTIAGVIRAWTANEKLYNETKQKLRETKHLLSGETFSVPQYMAQVIHE